MDVNKPLLVRVILLVCSLNILPPSHLISSKELIYYGLG